MLTCLVLLIAATGGCKERKGGSPAMAAGAADTAASLAAPPAPVRTPTTPDPDELQSYITSEPWVPIAPSGARQVQPLYATSAIYRNVGDWSDDSSTVQTVSGVADTWHREQQDVRVERFDRDEQGNLRLTHLEDVENDLIVKFVDPPVAFAETIQPCESVTGSSDIEVFRRSNPDRRIESGTASSSVTYDADQTLHTPAGRFECRRLVIECSSKFGLGESTVRTILYHADGVGLVAEHYVEKAVVLIFPRTVTRTMVLAAPPTHAPIHVTTVEPEAVFE